MGKPKKPEGALKASIRALIYKSLPPERICIYSIMGGVGQTAGIADIIGCFDGRALAIEAKVGRNKLTDDQQKFRAAWERAGGLFVLAYTVEDVARALGIKGLIW